MESLVGEKIGRYRILSELGAGGMGIVYAAEDVELGRRVALKILSTTLRDDAPMLERFRREARAASALNHQGICTVYSIEQHEDRPFIVMELIEGSTLAVRMRRPFEVDELLEIGIQIVDALESAHSKGIVHRDLKPANLMIDARGRVKILDFGLAKIEPPRAEKVDRLSQVETSVGASLQTVAGTVMGTVHYMSPEQARGQLTDARTDLFSLGAVLYQMATGQMPFPGETEAVIFDAILNREPAPVIEANPMAPAELGRIIGHALEKDRALRYQSATDLKTDLLRLKRDLDSGARRTTGLSTSRAGSEKRTEKSVAVLYFENLSGAKEDEYFRDGITEDIIAELSKIPGLKVFSRPTVLPYRDRPATPSQIGQQLDAAYVLAGSLRRAGNRLRISVQLVDTRTDFPLWIERYDREMRDVFEVQDEIALRIAEALRVTLTPREGGTAGRRPTESLEAYDYFLRARNHTRRRTRQDFEFALQKFEKAVSIDPDFALAHAGIANVCALYYFDYERTPEWSAKAAAASRRASAIAPDLPEVRVGEAWVLLSEGRNAEAQAIVRRVVETAPDCEGAWYLLGRALFSSGEYQALADVADAAIEAAGEDYSVFVPILSALVALGKEERTRNVRQRAIETLENQVSKVPGDARARSILAAYYSQIGRGDDAIREMQFAVNLRPTDPALHYNTACTYSSLGRRAEALSSLRKAWDFGYRDAVLVRHDPHLEALHGDPEFEKLYPGVPESRATGLPPVDQR